MTFTATCSGPPSATSCRNQLQREDGRGMSMHRRSCPRRRLSQVTASQHWASTRSFGMLPACNHGVRRDHGFSTAPGAGVVVARASHLLVGTAPRHQSWVLRIYPCNTILHMKHASMATHQKAARRAPRLLRRRPSRAPIAQASQSAAVPHQGSRTESAQSPSVLVAQQPAWQS